MGRMRSCALFLAAVQLSMQLASAPNIPAFLLTEANVVDLRTGSVDRV